LYANFWRVQTGEVAALPREFLERALERQSVLLGSDGDEP
jgi:ATP-binding cassette subfamily B protein